MADEVGQGIADTEESRDSRDRPHRGRTVTVGIDRLGNRGVAGGEAEQAADLREDGLLVGADQPGRTDLDRLRTIRPSTSTRTRSARAATWASWVTMTRVVPEACT